MSTLSLSIMPGISMVYSNPGLLGWDSTCGLVLYHILSYLCFLILVF